MTRTAGWRLRAYAKVNLSLEVLGRRVDGYHEVVSVAQTISLHDVVECRAASGIVVRADPPVVAAEANLVTRAAELLAERAERPIGAELVVRKRIPLAAGLGGGSSDAAATLRLLNGRWDLRLDDAELRRLAGALGSDVPLFLVGGTVAVAGRGEQVRRLASPTRFWLALACPRWAVVDKTRALYAALRPEDWTDGRRTNAFAGRLRSDRSIVGETLPNAFDRAADESYPGFAELRRRLSAAAGVPMRLTGAGPTLYALFATRHEAASAADRMAEVGLPCSVASSVGASRIVSIVGGGGVLS